MKLLLTRSNVRLRPIANIKRISLFLRCDLRRVGVKQLVAMVLAAFLPVAAASASVPSAAADEYGKKVAICTAKTDIDGQQCLAGLLTPVADQVKRTYKEALVRATMHERAAELRNAQAAWAKFVDAQCEFDLAQFRGGTGYWSVGYICRIERTAARIDDLSRGAGQ